MEKSNKPIMKHLSDYLDWIDIEKGLSSKTQENYKRFLQLFFKWLKKNNLENLKPHQLTADHVWKYRVFLSRKYKPQNKESLKRSTQNYYLIALRSLLSYFSTKDIVSLPSDKIKLSKTQKERKVNFLTLDQLKKLLSAPNTKTRNGLRDKAILETFFSTGMRIAELVSLNRNQIKLDSGENELEVVIVGKGSRPRTIYFSERAIKWLKKYLKSRDSFLNKNSIEEKALFINYRTKGESKRLTARAIEKSLKKYVIKTGLPINTSPHSLRHTFATDLLSQGVDLRTVQEFLGHKDIQATQIYTHVTNKRLRETHRKFHSGKKFKEKEH